MFVPSVTAFPVIATPGMAVPLIVISPLASVSVAKKVGAIPSNSEALSYVPVVFSPDKVAPFPVVVRAIF